MLISSLTRAEVDKPIVGNRCELYKISSTNNFRFFWRPTSVLNLTNFFFFFEQVTQRADSPVLGDRDEHSFELAHIPPQGALMAAERNPDSPVPGSVCDLPTVLSCGEPPPSH